MTAYLTLQQFTGLTVMPSSHVAQVETDAPGFLAAQLEAESRFIDSRLGKRYAAPFKGPTFPNVLGRWLVMLVTPIAYNKLGVFPSDQQSEQIESRRQQAIDELKEAADSEIGLFDLPLADTQPGSAIVYGASRVYSEQSPYVQNDRQRRTGRDEDRNGDGTYS